MKVQVEKLALVLIIGVLVAFTLSIVTTIILNYGFIF